MGGTKNHCIESYDELIRHVCCPHRSLYNRSNIVVRQVQYTGEEVFT